MDSAGDALGYSSGAFSVDVSAVFEALDFLQANLSCIAEAYLAPMRCSDHFHHYGRVGRREMCRDDSSYLFSDRNNLSTLAFLVYNHVSCSKQVFKGARSCLVRPYSAGKV